VNYIPSPYRYTLTLSDPTLVGKRRAAQRLAAATAQEMTKATPAQLNDELVTSVLGLVNEQMASEAGYSENESLCVVL
jgi:hypothetical protein